MVNPSRGNQLGAHTIRNDSAEGAANRRSAVRCKPALSKKCSVEGVVCMKAFNRMLLASSLALIFGLSAEASARPWYQNVTPNGVLSPFQHGTYPSLKSEKRPDMDFTHVGADIAAPCGSPVYPVQAGTVVDAITSSEQPNFSTLGYMVIISHGLDPKSGIQVYTTYFHLQSPPLIQSGQVEPTQKIGEVGQTGAAFGCHVHFEVRHFSGRFYPGWGNIYGPGNQNGTPAFLQNWSDPASFAKKASSAAIGSTQSQSQSAPLNSPARSGSAAVMARPAVAIAATPTNTLPGRAIAPGTLLPGATITISWSVVRGAAEYELTVRDMTENKALPIERLTRTYNIVRVKPGHTYRWSVKSCNQTGCSDASMRLYFTAQ